MSTDTADVDHPTETGTPSEYDCDCGAAFETAAEYGGHRRTCSAGYRCPDCADLDIETLEWYVHRTEAHGVPHSRFDYLRPGEFEESVDRADSVLDVADDLGWQVERVFRVLHVYGFEDRVGPGGEQ